MLASRRLSQLAVGGLITLPAYDKTGSPIRMHRNGCDAEPGCGCDLVFVEKVLMPNPNVLMWTMDRCDPQPREPEPEFVANSGPDLNSAEGAKLMDLYYAGVQVLVDLGVPLPQIDGPHNDIETTATHPSTAPAEPEPNVSHTSRDTEKPATKIDVPDAF